MLYIYLLLTLTLHLYILSMFYIYPVTTYTKPFILNRTALMLGATVYS